MRRFLNLAPAWIVAGLLGNPLAMAADMPTVDKLLEDMSGTLSSAQSLSVHVEKTYDDVIETGYKIQYSGAIDIALERPTRLYVSYGDDLSAKEAWYQGAEFVLVDHRHNVHGTIEASGTVDEALAQISDKYDVRLPLGALLSSNLRARIKDIGLSTQYIGLHDVGGSLAHHLLIVTERADIQLWIDSGEMPLPLKMVITRTDITAEPQQIFYFSEWDLAAEHPDGLFDPDIPDGSAIAAFLPREEN